MGEKQLETGPRQRIDKWLFFARMAKSRSAAQSLIVSRKVEINDAVVVQPSHAVRPGDRIVLAMPRRSLILLVKFSGSRRGPYEEAKLLYEDLTPPEDPETRLTAFEQATRSPGSGRPTKRERREIDRLMPGGDWDSD